MSVSDEQDMQNTISGGKALFELSNNGKVVLCVGVDGEIFWRRGENILRAKNMSDLAIAFSDSIFLFTKINQSLYTKEQELNARLKN